MNIDRVLLEAGIPCLLSLVAAFAGLWLALRISGARAAVGKLCTLHRCERGGVQTISFVLTLPVFMMLVLFIVQVSQFMIAITVVHYAAFAAARAASVWIPAEMTGNGEPANQVSIGTIDPETKYPKWATLPLNYSAEGSAIPSWKCQKIWSAAVMACTLISPSRRYLNDFALQQANSRLVTDTVDLYRQLVPHSAKNPQLPERIRNKAAYAADHAWIKISGSHKRSAGGATYNPHDHNYPPSPLTPEAEFPDQWHFRPNESGWEDEITVQVSYRFALLPGPGRFLSPAHFLSTELPAIGGTRDRVSRRIHLWDKEQHPAYRESVYYTVISATATMPNDGLKSIIPIYETAEALR
jgi:TadE-like protein